MVDHGHTPKRLFTPSEANAMLPLVGAIVTDLVKLSPLAGTAAMNVAWLSADQVVPLRVRAVTVVVPRSGMGPLATRASGATAPPRSRGSEPLSV